MPRQTFVYVVEAENGLIKIGCSEWPDRRLQLIRTHTPLHTRLLAMWQGDRREEGALHKRLRAQGHHSEWFRIDGPVLDFVAEVRGRGLDRIEEWSELSFLTADGRKTRGAVRRGKSMKQAWSDPDKRREWLILLAEGRELRQRLGPKYWNHPDHRQLRAEIRSRVTEQADAAEARHIAAAQERLAADARSEKALAS